MVPAPAPQAREREVYASPSSSAIAQAFQW